MKYFLVIIAIICMIAFVGAQEDVVEQVTEPVVDFPKSIPEPLPVTRLNVTIIDGINDKLVRLENCVVQVLGELHIAEDSFNYSNTFVEGDRYDITISIRVKK